MRHYNLDPRFDPAPVRTIQETINFKVMDENENYYPAILMLDVNDYEVTVTGVVTKTSEAICDPHDDIVNAIREHYRNQEIIFNLKTL